jgi:hypothetical protein
VSGANTAMSTPLAASTKGTCAAVVVPSMRARAAVTRWLTGLASTNRRSQSGMVAGSTKLLLRNVSGNRTTNPMLMTAFGDRRIRASVVQAQDSAEAKNTVADLIGLIAAEVGDWETIEPAMSGLMFEAMREAERDDALRQRMGGMLAEYRQLIAQAVRADQERGAIVSGAPAPAVATLLAAVGDGLLLQALLDRDLDVTAALDALRTLLSQAETPGQP